MTHSSVNSVKLVTSHGLCVTGNCECPANPIPFVPIPFVHHNINIKQKMQGKTARVGFQEVGVLNTTLQENAPQKNAIFSTNSTSAIRDNTQLSNVGTNIQSSLTQHQNHNKLIVHQINDKPLHLPTPIKLDKLTHWLQVYEKVNTDFCYMDLKMAFASKVLSKRLILSQKNLKSALQYPNIVSQKIAKEVKLGRIAGPFSEPPFEKFTISPIGLQPKRQPGEFRLIHHLSYPH